MFKFPQVNPKATPHSSSTHVCWFNALSWCSLLPSRWFCSFLPSERINSMAFNYWATAHSWKWTGMFRDPSQSIEVSGLKNKCVCVSVYIAHSKVLRSLLYDHISTPVCLLGFSAGGLIGSPRQAKESLLMSNAYTSNCTSHRLWWDASQDERSISANDKPLITCYVVFL